MTHASRGSAHRRPPRFVLAAAFGLWLAVPATGADWFPSRDLLPLMLAAPREPVCQALLVRADPNPADYGPGPAGEVAVSMAAAVLQLAGADASDALVLGIEGGAFARFSFAVITRELVNTDWVFTAPLVWHRPWGWLRLRYLHTSSHLGDEYQQRFGPSSINFSRDAFDLTAFWHPRAAPVAGLGLYAGGLWSYNSHPEEAMLGRMRAGIEIDPSNRTPWQPCAAVDAEYEGGTTSAARVTAQVGLWLPRVEGRPLRIALQASAGASAMGQFTTNDEGRVAVGLLFHP